MYTIDYNKCTSCGACVDGQGWQCPMDAISWSTQIDGHEGERLPEIDYELCTDCGECYMDGLYCDEDAIVNGSRPTTQEAFGPDYITPYSKEELDALGATE